jgi:hypothetical protein
MRQLRDCRPGRGYQSDPRTDAIHVEYEAAIQVGKRNPPDSPLGWFLDSPMSLGPFRLFAIALGWMWHAFIQGDHPWLSSQPWLN